MTVESPRVSEEALFPWGKLFALSENYAYGFFLEEGRLVAKYLTNPSDILIIGSGNGREARPVCRDGHRIVCMDFGLIYLQSGKRLFEAEGHRDIRFVAADMHRMPFPRQCFDFVFMTLYSSGRERRHEVMRGIHEILRPGGYVLLTACTRRHKPVNGYAFVDSTDELRREMSCNGYLLIEGEIDPDRPEYLAAILQKHS